jgi:hypothetical protein
MPPWLVAGQLYCLLFLWKTVRHTDIPGGLIAFCFVACEFSCTQCTQLCRLMVITRSLKVYLSDKQLLLEEINCYHACLKTIHTFQVDGLDHLESWHGAVSVCTYGLQFPLCRRWTLVLRTSHENIVLQTFSKILWRPLTLSEYFRRQLTRDFRSLSERFLMHTLPAVQSRTYHATL